MDQTSQSYSLREYKYNLKILKILHLTEYIFFGILVIFLLTSLLRNNLATISGLTGICLVGLIEACALLLGKKEIKKNRDLEEYIENTWGKGTIAEMMVRDDLESLPSDYKVISNYTKIINGVRTDIDFIIVCWRGVFSLEVKANGGLITYRDNKLYSFQDPLRNDGGIEQCKGNAVYLSDLLKRKFGNQYFVQGILEYPRGTIDKKTIHGKIDHIWIGGSCFHEYAIKKSESKLTLDEISSVYNFLINEGSVPNEAK